MRVYEIARELGVSSKDISTTLAAQGYGSLAHMSVLSEEMVLFLRKKYTNTSGPDNGSGKVKSLNTTNLGQKNNTSPSHHQASAPDSEPLPIEVLVSNEMPVYEVAKLFNKSSGELILQLMRAGILCNRNRVLSVDEIIEVGKKLGFVVRMKKDDRVFDRITPKGEVEEDPRWPIVVIMGHVDHGKTSLLDRIRKTNIADKEVGGITQHLGAHEVESSHGKIVFLDTPGHEAFSHMRQQGTNVTDIAILVVAADDGIMPQTIEAIECAKRANVPIIVAINKVDKPDSQAGIERINRQLAEHDLLPEDWGGQTVCVPVSAKTGSGIEELLEMIVLQAQMMELYSHPSSPVKGYVLESNIEKGYGPVATIISVQGTLKVGDFFTCGSLGGRVRLLITADGQRVKKIGPSVPVKVVGFDAVPSSGSLFEVISSSEMASFRKSGMRKSSIMSPDRTQKSTQSINVIIKASTYGSTEAMLGAIAKINAKQKEKDPFFNVIFSGVGNISEQNVVSAMDTDATVIGLDVGIERRAAALAKEHSVSVSTSDIIYRLIEQLQDILASHSKPEISFKKIGEAVVRKVFNIKGQGVIAGSYVTTGSFNRSCKVVCIRNGQEIGSGFITSLQKDRKVLKEVSAGVEFAFISSGFQEWSVGDEVHCLTESS